MTVYSVSNATQLQSAINNAVGGDKIILADGNYGTVWIQNKNPVSTITIQAANPGTSVHLDSLNVYTSKNLSFSGFDVGRALSGTEPEWTQLTAIRDSSNIKFDSMNFHGSLDGDPSNDGICLYITGVSGFSVTNSSMKEGFRGFVAVQSSNITVKNNDFTLLRSDGMISAGNDGIMIDGNRFTNFHPIEGDHGDAIQFFNLGQPKGQSNITIKNNVQFQIYFSGVESTGVQGIWISDPDIYGYKNVLIQNNMMYSNDLYNGIGVAGATGLQIIGNTIISKPTDDKMFWIRLEADSQVLLKDNVTDNILTTNVTDFFQSGNINFMVDPSARARFANLINPSGVEDVITPGVGYQVPTHAPAAPVSTAVGGGISSMLAGNRGAGAGSPVALQSDSDANHAVASIMRAPEPAPFSPQPAEAAFMPAHAPAHLIFDHFTAIP